MKRPDAARGSRRYHWSRGCSSSRRSSASAWAILLGPLCPEARVTAIPPISGTVKMELKKSTAYTAVALTAIAPGPYSDVGAPSQRR